MSPGSPLRVALCSGILVCHDAISNSLRLKLELLRRLRRGGAAVEVTAFVLGTDDEAADIVPVGGLWPMVTHPGFRRADVAVYEFGIYYELFDSVFLLPSSRVVATYHNITPRELVVEPAALAAVERALVQKHNLAHVGHVICDSEYNRDDLVEFGIEPSRLHVHHLPPARSANRRPDLVGRRPVRLAFLGRLVRPKGVLDVVAACDRLGDRGVDGFRLDVVGPPLFSEPAVLNELQARAARRPYLRFLGELDDGALATLMSLVDVLVVPSYHEGYCVPVVEAYAAGCQVVAYDSTNLPNVVGRFGQLVPTGDVGALAEALALVISSVARRQLGDDTAVPTSAGPLDFENWRTAVEVHLADYSRDAFEQGFLDVLEAAAGRPLCLGHGAVE